ncbi:High-copy suppressor of rspA [Ewingella americana]|uniref:High-copy suppressor of rspA n=1 Tax=Ewingella americana TaxID=41202 RepID=A0A377NCF7_9GAMM|nr:High-copy suppressor of rspA [Ewingella americana]
MAIVLFALASILCSVSTSLATFTAARMLQGFSGALMVPVGRLVVLRNTSKSDLIRAIATITWPVWSRPLSARRWVVLLPLLPLGTGFSSSMCRSLWVALYFSQKLVPALPGEKGVPFDWLGFVLTGAACLGLMFGLDLFNQQGVSWLPIACVVGSILLGALTVLHSIRTPFPLLPMVAMKIKSYAVTIYGGSLFRIAIGALPFLLPLMFQLGYGMSAFDAGLLVLAVFAGNLAMKPFTSAILHRFKFRSVMLVNGILNSLTIFACALLTPEVPTSLTLLLLFASGMTRSMQFTALNTLTFSQVPSEQMGGANTLANTVQQLSTGLGITIGALSLRVAEHFQTDAGSTVHLEQFHVAFIIIGLFSLVGTLNNLSLSPTAGDEIRRKKAPPSSAPAGGK